MIPPLDILARIDVHTLATESEGPRKYLGASEVGEKCLRKLWYKFRWCGQEKTEPRMLRLFARGHREEPVIFELLKNSGFIVRTPAAEGEEAFQFKDCEGHFAGTCDGVIAEGDYKRWLDFQYDPETLEWFCLSCKTYCLNDFANLKRLGVKENNPKYYHQEQTYMGELGFEWTLFFAVCKDNDEIYLEWIPFNRIDFETNLSKAETVINATTPPDRISNDPKTFTCRFCPFNRICHENIPIAESSRHCRNCVHGSPAAGGRWDCNNGHPFGTCCSDYKPLCGGSAAN